MLKGVTHLYQGSLWKLVVLKKLTLVLDHLRHYSQKKTILRREMSLETPINFCYQCCTTVLEKVPALHFFIRVMFCGTLGISYVIVGKLALMFKRVPSIDKAKCRESSFAAEWGTQSSFTTKEGLKLDVFIRGEPGKPVILFLHGFPDCWLSWKQQMKFFADKGYRCAALRFVKLI